MRQYADRLRIWVHTQIRAFALWLLAWVDTCPTCGAPWGEHHCPYTPIATGQATRVCEVCGRALPADALRTHDGRWRCAIHKAV